AATTAGDDRLVAQAHLQTEMVLSEIGDPRSAVHGRAARRRFERLGDNVGLGNVLLNLGVSAYNRGRIVDALGLYEGSEAAYERAGDVIGGALVANNRAEVLTDQGRFEDAARLLQRARRLFRATGYGSGVAMTTSAFSRLALRGGDTAEADRLLDEALAEFRSLDAANYVADTLVRRVENLVAAGRADEALVVATTARAALDQQEQPALLPEVLARLVAMACVSRGDVAAAERALDAAGTGRGVRSRLEAALRDVVRAAAHGAPLPPGARRVLRAEGVTLVPVPAPGGRWSWEPLAADTSRPGTSAPCSS
ncbi:MAG TPA: tetratricopeptide repeat protein, partial [Acidimicrobiales bacterium]